MTEEMAGKVDSSRYLLSHGIRNKSRQVTYKSQFIW